MIVVYILNYDYVIAAYGIFEKGKQIDITG